MHDFERQKNLEITVAEIGDRVNMLTDAVSAIHQQTQLVLSSKENEEPNRSNKMRDSVWVCENCAARLGIYDPIEDQLRVRYKDFVCYIKPGDGGVVRVPCRRCGLDNTLKDTRRNAKAIAGQVDRK